MNKKRNTFLALSLAIVMLVTVVPQFNYISGEEVTQTAGIVYNFANNDAGSAYGTISVTTEDAGTYEIYWGDSEGNKLKYNGVEYSELGTVKTTSEKLTADFKVISPYTAIPEGAQKLLVCNNEEQVAYTYDIPVSKQFDGGKLSYRFGVISDIHYNRYDDFSDDDGVGAFENALKFLNTQGIDFVCSLGDLSAYGELDAFTKYNTAINKYPNMTVYSCMGNHDASYTYYEGNTKVANFAKYVNVKRTTDKNIKSINDTGVDFVYEKNGDIFIFLSQIQWKFSVDSFLLLDSQLNWLEKNLNTYANKNIYLFFHTYFANENGDIVNTVGNLQNAVGYTYELVYPYGAKDEKRFRSLLNKYPNVTLFGGHSHWAYDQQKYNPYLNIGNIKNDKTGASLVHVSSVTEPRTVGENDTDRTGNNGVMSEGTIAFKYADSIVYTGVDFKNGKYLAYATYLNQDGKKSNPVAAVKTGKTKITKVGKVKKMSKKSKKYKVTIKYKKISGAYKYQIQYSTSKKFKAKKTKTRYTKKTSYTITKLKRKTKYYIRVRAYRYQFGYRINGEWSKTKRIKTKK